MATCRSLLMVPITLCFLLLVLPAQSKVNLAGKENLVGVILYGTARCKSNPSKIISNATLHVSVNGTTLAAGKTTSSGRFLIAARVSSKDQLSAMVSKNVVITAPRQACSGGLPAPAATATTRKLAAQADRNGYRILADNTLGDLVDDEILVDDGDIRRFIVDNEFESSIVNIGPEVLELLNFIEDSGRDSSDLLSPLTEFPGIPGIAV